MDHAKKKSKKSSSKSGSSSKPKNINEEVRFTQDVVKKGLRNVASHHIESFDYAMNKCLPRICSYMLPVEVTNNFSADAPSGAGTAIYPFSKYRMWFESFELRKPSRPTAGGAHGLVMGNEAE